MSEYTKTTNACIKSADENSIKGGRSHYASSNQTHTLVDTGVVPSQVEPDSTSVGKFSSMSIDCNFAESKTCKMK